MTTQHAAAKTIRELRNNVCRKGMSGWTANNRVVQLCRLTADRNRWYLLQPTSCCFTAAKEGAVFKAHVGNLSRYADCDCRNDGQNNRHLTDFTCFGSGCSIAEHFTLLISGYFPV